jgi:hypothetical protein
MKNLIYFFLLFSTVVSSQNYNYAIDEPQKTAKPTGVNNQPEEIAYFNAYLLPLSQKANLQKALDTYGAVRLEKGDYSGVKVVMHTGQKLYGHPSLSPVSNITIAARSSNVVLQDLFLDGNTITLQAGGVISNCTIKTAKWTTIIGDNAMIENCSFLNITGFLHFDCSASGYFRNNRFIKHMQMGLSDMIVMKGNSTTPSYGNTHLHTNFLSLKFDATTFDNLQSTTFIGADAEAWNIYGTIENKAMLDMKNMGDVKIAGIQGNDEYSSIKTPPFNIDANNLLFFNRQIGIAVSSVISARANLISINDGFDNPVRSTGTVTGFKLDAQSYGNTDIYYDGTNTTSLISNPTPLAKAILGTQYTPWTRPTWETLPDPLGTNWKIERIGKPDQATYIQNLINTNRIAELPEGIFYIGSTLTLSANLAQGITGKGTGKTVIVGLTDDFPLISLAQPNGAQNFVLDNLTLQGGSVGLYAPDEIMQLSTINLKYLVFRNQNYGIQLHWIFGLDNCFFDSLSFVDCNIGFFQDPDNSANPGFNNAGYVDKVVFYNGQYLNCGTAVSLIATRADNLNAWINCKFNNNNTALTLSSNNMPLAINCDFTHTKGNAVVDGDMNYYSCNFNNNTTSYMFNSKNTYMEGCSLLDDITVFSNKEHYYENHFILNSTITGSLGGGSGQTNGVFVNSNFLANPALSKLLVNLKANVPTTLINTTSTPYPQLLVTQ